MGTTFFSLEDADHIFNELKELHVDLDDDPLSFGPKRLNMKVSEIRRMLGRCERLFLDCSQKLHGYRRSLKVETLGLEMTKKHLFANDPETRAGRSVSDREAIASGKLQGEIHKVHDLEMAVNDLESVLMVIKAKRMDLKDAEGRLRDQVRLCQDELGLGSRWGSKAPGNIDLTPGLADQTELKNMTDLLQGMDAEIHLMKLDGSWTDPPEASADPVADAQTPIEEASEQEPEETEKLLPPTATQQETDTFLDLDFTNDPPAKQDTRNKPALDDDGLEDILKSFEKVE